MPTTTKKKKRRVKIGDTWVTVDPNMKTHENDPFFVKKAEAAKAFIEKYGLPEEVMRKKK